MKSNKEGQKLDKIMRLKEEKDIPTPFLNKKNSKESSGRTISFKDSHLIKERTLKSTINTQECQSDYTRIDKHAPLKSIHASNYLLKAEPYLSNLVSHQNFNEIVSIAHYFPGNLTSFLGFECRLGDTESRADWAFAISGIGGDREVLVNLMRDKNFPRQFFQKPEWKHITDFAKDWTNPTSILRNKIQCFWLEFDMPESNPDVPVPSVFFGPEKNPDGIPSNDISQYNWLTNNALPLLRGQHLPQLMEDRLLDCFKLLPKNASIQFIGVMLSRKTNGVRLYIKRLHPMQIVSYLNSIGWSDESGEFSSLVTDLENLVDRFVIGFDVNTDGIGSKVGIECSFSTNRFQDETRWNDFLDYLVDKGICLPEKRDALLEYSGIESADNISGGVMKPLTSASKNLEELVASVVVRYISHIKILYQAGQRLEAKAYPAVRLFRY